ncbi:acyl carrier protein [Micromonospora sp. NPDC049662]|uniref:acyl carrier protein n=1 Tax=Micromonospora sp. NPDC049662 TaxID=3155397 RepID=UPI0034233491
MDPWDDDFEAALHEVIPPEHHSSISPTTELLSIGLDSMGSMQLIILLEDAYEIEFPLDYLNPEVLATPSSLWAALSVVRAGSELGPT